MAVQLMQNTRDAVNSSCAYGPLQVVTVPYTIFQHCGHPLLAIIAAVKQNFLQTSRGTLQGNSHVNRPRLIRRNEERRDV